MGDAPDVLAWRNDPATCAASKTGAIDLTSHLAWFARAITGDLFIAEHEGRKIGMVRFDDHVSINVAPEFRRQGLGAKMLNMAIQKIAAQRLSAEIKPENVASRRLFAKCGFQINGMIDGLELWTRDARPHEMTGLDTADLDGQ